MRRNLGLIVAVAALALTQQACANGNTSPSSEAAGTTSAPAPEPSPDKPSPVPSPSKTKSAATPKDPILAGKRQVVIAPIESSEGIVQLNDEGDLWVTEAESEFGLFVLAPHNGRFQIKTAKVTSGGEPSCLGVKNNGSQSLSVAAAACDTSRAGQLFDIEPIGKKDQSGRPIYSIANNGAFLQMGKNGLILEELGDAPLLTTYVFVDNGKSTLPKLD